MRAFTLALFLMLAKTICADGAWALDPAATGVVLLHGKWGDPSNVRPIGDALEAAGYTVERPTMPWAGYRSYDKSYQGAMDEVAQAVAKLRAKGMRHVVVGGHSLGGNATLHFGTLDGTLAALVVVAPAHAPDGRRTAEMIAAEVKTAREMVAAGEGNDTVSFQDFNTGGRRRGQRLTAAIFLSYFAPDGPAAMSLSAANLKVGRVAWLAPSDDPTTADFERVVVPAMAPTVRLDRIGVRSDHMGAPQAAASAIVEWLNAVPAE